MIENGAMDGQRTSHRDLESAMRRYISEHKTEFFPEGMDEASVAGDLAINPTDLLSPIPNATLSADELMKARQRETEQRGLQWLLDTVMGTWDVARKSTAGAIEILGDLLEIAPRPTVFGFIIIVLVISNIWTLVSLKGANQRDALTHKRKQQEASGNGILPVFSDGSVPDASADALRVLLEGVMARGGEKSVAEAQILPPSEELQSIHDAVASLELRIGRLKVQLAETTLTEPEPIIVVQPPLDE